MTAITLHSYEGTIQALLKIPSGTAARLYNATVERSINGRQFRINGACWMSAEIAARAIYILGKNMSQENLTPRQKSTSRQAIPLEPIFPPDMRAISTSAPHAYLICTGEKEAEYRKWKTNLRDTIILIHAYSSDRFDYLFEQEDIPKNKCPKSAILGAVTIVDCEWDSRWNQYAHIYATPMLFKKPILGVSGKLNYWQAADIPAIKAFNTAWKYLMEG